MNNFYRTFEDRYRGSRELIKSRLAAYAPFTDALATVYPGAPILDLGCGRGEWLEIMTAAGFDAWGVDLDEGMLAACRERGLKVRTEDALTTLRNLPDASVAMVSAFHLVEHLPFANAQTMIAESLRVLLPGGLLIMETPNPENILVGTNTFYLDPSHLKPIPPILLDFMADYAGFTRHRIVRLSRDWATADAAIGLRQVLQDVSADYGVVAQKQGEPDTYSRFDAAFDAPYGLGLEEMAERFDQRIVKLHSDSEAAIAALGGKIAGHDEALTSLDKASTELWSHALPGLEHSVTSLATRIEQLQAGVDEPLKEVVEALSGKIAGHDEALARMDKASAELWSHALPGLEHSVTSLATRVEQLQAGVDERMKEMIARIDQVKDEADAASETALARLNESIAQLEQRTVERIMHSERRLTRAEARAAPLGLRLQQAEAAVAAAAARVQNAEAHATMLQQQIDAILASSSWRITAPARQVRARLRRIVDAKREGRIKSGLRRRLIALVTPILGSAHPEGNTGLRGWLRQSKEKTWIRRIALPLLHRFPQLRAPLRRLAGIATPPPPPTGDIMLPDWPAPLPAEYLTMPASTRKVLLDLARAQQSSPHP